ncbi:GntR family transcriptional regulator [Streptomyces sp. DvalAA-14]|uniref:GntR family transcriptional regulator n=1 Tax=unclassified Streptomyces TaxID=2593676 RepID=UPI00081AFC6F|nr:MULTISPECIES: GntR family transcriptional regulator [unclassified Streptomyces]MYS22578.1 UTRA domain-containing protein [Streptomyces sp. SID4948]SCE18685.1 GntR family transcriptional regulator [Streptomyces sp. DvalAA-14]
MTARHQQVADDLRRLIASGTLPVGERLAPETQLAAHYRVSTPTLRDALELLRAEGLIEKFQGRGNYVRRPPERLTYPRADGTEDLHVTVSSTDLAATEDLAARLRTRPNDAVTEYVCLSHGADSPQSLAHLYVPHAVARIQAPPIGASPWGDDILTAAGVLAAASTDQVTARFPTAAEAQSLRIGARTPVLAVERTIAADDGQIVAYALLVLPGDRAEVAVVTRIDKKAEA